MDANDFAAKLEETALLGGTFTAEPVKETTFTPEGFLQDMLTAFCPMKDGDWKVTKHSIKTDKNTACFKLNPPRIFEDVCLISDRDWETCG